jgi:hypothetical protein
MNVGTPKEGITAPVVFVHDYTEREGTIAPTGRRELPQKEPSGWAAKTLVLSSRRAPVALSPHTVGKHYFDWHHSEADTLDKVDPAEFRHNIALLAITSYGQRRRLAISGSRKDRESREGVCSYRVHRMATESTNFCSAIETSVMASETFRSKFIAALTPQTAPLCHPEPAFGWTPP